MFFLYLLLLYLVMKDGWIISVYLIPSKKKWLENLKNFFLITVCVCMLFVIYIIDKEIGKLNNVEYIICNVVFGILSIEIYKFINKRTEKIEKIDNIIRCNNSAEDVIDIYRGSNFIIKIILKNYFKNEDEKIFKYDKNIIIKYFLTENLNKKMSEIQKDNIDEIKNKNKI